MKNEIKAFCTDIDGTLLNAERWLSKLTVSAFAKADLPIIFASARMPNAMGYLQDGLGIKGEALIAYNGGLILGKGGKQLQSNNFSTEVLERLIPHHKSRGYNLSIYSHNHWFTDKEDAWSLREINNTRVHPKYQSVTESLRFLESENLGIHKLMCMGAVAEIDEIITFLEADFSDTVHFYRSKDTYVEITPKNIDKAKALEFLLAAEFDFDIENVISFGDNHNDVELLRRSGWGVAVANGTKNVKDIANYVSPFTNKEDAVALAVAEFVL
ncbi:Cof-type HAD-IIB family hydrolase [Dokdonia sinensis]|uniref:Cof-type HAD-IIB family hydrolase n=1 Tax=Dokdonia sinensis TaxID=2479847 RepID=A0A3M0G7L7_9FLAO|nr:Cof-type HAD-IIB family hydrolase [Dokdonia sinensis]RMB61030.1 Cof-type HAD-IIB family hydrolase [Dokdonia sinensis]